MVRFNSFTHEYFDGDKKLISATQLMQKHGLSPDYSNVDAEVLAKKAERGTLIHEELEEYIKFGKLGFSQELYSFIAYVKSQKIKFLASEKLVHNDIAAGTVDFLYEKNKKVYRVDFKTTVSLNESSVKWQLGIYDELDDVKADAFQVFHFDKYGILHVVDITPQPKEEVQKLLECERKGIIYHTELVIPDKELLEIKTLTTLIKKLEKEKDEATKRYNVFVDALREQMEIRDLKEFTKDGVKIECKGGRKPSTRKNETITLNEEKFKEENLEAYEIYKKYLVKETTTVDVKGSPNKITITILEDNDNEKKGK